MSHRQCSKCSGNRVMVLPCHSLLDTAQGKPAQWIGVCYRLGCNHKTAICGSMDAVRDAWNDLNKDMPYAEPVEAAPIVTRKEMWEDARQVRDDADWKRSHEPYRIV